MEDTKPKGARISDEVDPNIAVADMSEQILRMVEATEALLKIGLTHKAIVILLHNKIGVTKITKRDIENVLWAIPRLKDFIS